MNPIGLIDLATLCATAVALVCLLGWWNRALRSDVKALFAVLLALYLFHDVSNTMEWLLGASALDAVEDYVDVLRPMFWGFFFYAFVQARAQRRLSANEERFRLLAETAFDGISICEVDPRSGARRLVFCNDRYAEMSGHTRRELMAAEDLNELETPLASPEEVRRWDDCIREGIPFSGRSSWRRPDGRENLHEFSAVAAQVDGKLHLFGVDRDVTERSRAEAALRESEERYRLISENATDPISLHDPQDMSYLYVNPATVAAFGYERDELLGKSPLEFLHEEDREYVWRRFEYAVERGKGSAEFRFRRKGGSYVWLESTGNVTTDERGRPVVLVISRDITERVQRREQLRALTLEDALTHVHNRRGFLLLAEQQLKVANRTSSRLILFFADIDRMKWINDHFGHKEGDLALIETSNALREAFRESDIIARIGGDEFAVLALEANGGEPDGMLRRLHERLEARNAQPGRRYSLSLSVGAATYDPTDPQPLDELIARADAMMYERKRGKQAEQ